MALFFAPAPTLGGLGRSGWRDAAAPAAPLCGSSQWVQRACPWARSPVASTLARQCGGARSIVLASAAADAAAAAAVSSADASGSTVPRAFTDEHAWRELRALLTPGVLARINKPARYLGNEFGAVHKPWDGSDVRFCLAYPELYEVGMSNTGHVILYSCVNDVPGLLCDRSYLPGADMAAALKEQGKELFAVESKRPLRDFDLLAIPVHYEMGATNCLELLHLAGIPFGWRERDAAESNGVEGLLYPLVFAGGQTITGNPEPFADFFDFFSLGDGEETLPEVGRVVQAELKRDPTASRETLLLALAQRVPGVYVPRFYAPAPDGSGAVRPLRDDVPARPQRQTCAPQPERALALVPYIETVHDRHTVEIRRGCTRGCRFCAPGMINRPARDVEPEAVRNAVVAGVTQAGYREFSLLSLSCSDWLSLPSVGVSLKNELAQHHVTLSLPSQRVDRFDENIALIMSNGQRKSGMTFAPEAGTQRMRDVINKGLTNEDLLRGVRTAYAQGWSQVKLYFMVGLPGETDEDVIGIADTIKWLQRECKEKGRPRLALNVTISNFTPKAQTPFQWHSVSTREFQRKHAMIKSAIRGSARDVKLNFTDVRISCMEDFVGRGDRRLGAVIRAAWEQGASMDDWWMNVGNAFESWKRAIEAAGLSWNFRKAEAGEWNVMDTQREAVRGARGWFDEARNKQLDRSTLLPKNTHVDQNDVSSMSPLDRPLPWDHIDCGLDKGWLRDELMHALDAALTPDCSFDVCSQCGVCGDELGNNVVIEPPNEIPPLRTKATVDGIVEEFVPAQKVRILYAKTGPMTMISNLDLWRLMDRATLRAQIPLGYSNQIHPHPKIANAYALPLGMSSEAELMDFELSERMDVSQFRTALAAQLPEGLDILDCREVEARGKKVTLASLLQHAEYVVCLEATSDPLDWAAAVVQVEALEECFVKRKTKRGKIEDVNVRPRLVELALATPQQALPVRLHVEEEYEDAMDGTTARLAYVRYVGLSNNDGQLSAEQLAMLFRVATGREDIELRHAHRTRLLRQGGDWA
ncbi:Uncharacterized protein FVE85_1172 [Porphyridium purpureum]|uniref:Radical SAM core domain-containing protein n=1 Tax=Porphyridium purpureum TaxID=35688 RepID=A0A5J4Z3D1_PORPP|nr:Uncharacterized protein FVE85_1172 [Porphyridium purpureum]|eukprot:POR0297..scf208_2